MTDWQLLMASRENYDQLNALKLNEYLLRVCRFGKADSDSHSVLVEFRRNGSYIVTFSSLFSAKSFDCRSRTDGLHTDPTSCRKFYRYALLFVIDFIFKLQ